MKAYAIDLELTQGMRVLVIHAPGIASALISARQFVQIYDLPEAVLLGKGGNLREATEADLEAAREYTAERRGE